jgi:hypothetical protein
MFTEAASLQKANLSLVAVAAALALAAFAALSAAPRLQTNSTPAAVVTQAVRGAPIQIQPAIDRPSCGGGYVTGDLVGDGSPAAVYAALCGTR